MSEVAVLTWAGLVFATILNGCTAGIAAILHARRSNMPRAGKILTAGLVTGLLTALMYLPFAIFAEASAPDGALINVLLHAVLLVVATVVSLPGALVVLHKLDSPGNVHRDFE